MVAQRRGHGNLRRANAENDPCPAVGLFADTVANQQGEEDTDNTGGHVHQSSSLGGVTKVANKGCGVSRNNTARDGELTKVRPLPLHIISFTYQDDGENHEVQLRIHKSLKNLLGAELAALNTSLVDANMLQQSNLLLVRQPTSLHGGVGKEEESSETDHDGDEAENNKHGAPPSKRSSRAHMLEAIRNETTNNLAKTQTQVPKRKTRGLLGLGVPLAADEHQGRTNCSLKDTEEDTGDEEGLVVVGGGTTSGRDTP